MIHDILEAELAPEPVEHGWLGPGPVHQVDPTLEHLAKYLSRQQYSLEEAKTAAARYNTFVSREAHRTGRPPTDAAIVRSEPNERGSYEIWFPLVASRVDKIARQARQALKAAA